MKKRRIPLRATTGTVMAMLWLGSGAQAQLLLVSASPPSTVSKYTPEGTASIFSSSLGNPKGLVFDSSGNLFAGDYGSGAVYEFTSGGTQSTYANVGGLPVGAAFDSAGNLYESDYTSGNIYKIMPGGSSQTFFASGLGGPEALAFDRAGNLYVACQKNSQVIEITPDGRTSTFASGLSRPEGLAFNGAGVLFVSCLSSIIEIATNGAQATFLSGLDEPDGIAFDGAGNLYVAETPEYSILKVSPQGTPSFFAATDGFSEPSTLAFQPIPSVQAACVDGAFQLSVTMPSPYYTTIVQSSPDLLNWTGVYTNIPPFTFMDSAAGSSRFYRAVLDINFF
jgi:sugar lactone lactonase YvrE